MSDEVVNLFAQRFIQRRDVKAIQHSNGEWSPHTSTGKRDGERLPWSRQDLQDHLACKRTFGHYLLDTDSLCKIFAFDVDLEEVGFYDANFTSPEGSVESLVECNPREAWRDRSHPGRPFFKYQFKLIAHKLCKFIYSELALQCAVAYSGAKGIHVYAFMEGPRPARDAREGAQIVIDAMGGFSLKRGQHFFQHTDFPNLSVEVFPKQTTLDGKDLGNLMRLPLGRNLKSSDPTFFVDMTSPMSVMQPVDPVWALTTDNPWKRPGE